MKLTKEESASYLQAAKHEAAIVRLAKVLQDSTITRDGLCGALAALELQLFGYDEAATAECIFRLLNGVEAHRAGKLEIQR